MKKQQETRGRLARLLDRIVIFFGGIMCKLGRHSFNDKYVGLLYRQCDKCKNSIQVCDEYSYKPSKNKR